MKSASAPYALGAWIESAKHASGAQTVKMASAGHQSGMYSLSVEHDWGSHKGEAKLSIMYLSYWISPGVITR